MTTAYQLKTGELDATFVERVKAAFPHKLIEITVTEADETPSLPDARPGPDRFRCGGSGSKFLAGSLTIVAAVVMAAAAVAQEVVKLPDKVAQEAKCLNPEFLFYRPKGVDADQKAPLLIYLHGRAERGRDIKVIQRVSRWGLSANAQKHNFLLVMPRCDTDAKGEEKGAGRWKAEDVKLLLEHVKGEHKIDENRIYLAGYSMGGFGTWATAIAYPQTFAAIAPIAGGGDPLKAEAIKHLPVWAFHAQNDAVVPHKGSEDMVEALRKQGNKKVKFTSSPDQGAQQDSGPGSQSCRVVRVAAGAGARQG